MDITNNLTHKFNYQFTIICGSILNNRNEHVAFSDSSESSFFL